jgi:hypothetical protein
MSYASPTVAWDFRSALASTRGEAITLALAGTASRNASGLLCDASGEAATVSAPASVQLAFPLTLAIWYTAQGAPANGVVMAGVSPTGFGFPFRCYSLDIESNKFAISGNQGGSYFGPDTGDTPPSSGAHTLVGVYTASGLEVYLDGTVILPNDGVTRSSPNYGTPTLYIGGESSGNSNALYTGVVIDNTAWTSGNVSSFHADPGAYVSGGASTTPFRPYYITG